MTAIQKKVITMGIKIKLARGEDLEDILATYVNLSEDEKIEIRTSLE
nr:hypothetical protein [Sedimentibacter sp.]